MTVKDTIYAQPHEAVGEFQFDESVVAVFPDMIQRSVPGYQTILTGIGELTAQYAQPDSQLYDLGCSLGAASLTMRRKAPSGCRIIGVDTSQPMIDRAREHIEGFHSDIPVTLQCEDMTETVIENASVVVINFTLQFIEPEARQSLIDRIYKGLRPGGILILSEKSISIPNRCNRPSSTCICNSNAPTVIPNWKSARNARLWKTCSSATPKPRTWTA